MQKSRGMGSETGPGQRERGDGMIERERDRQTDRQTDRQRQTETDRETERQRETDRDREAYPKFQVILYTHHRRAWNEVSEQMFDFQ